MSAADLRALPARSPGRSTSPTPRRVLGYGLPAQSRIANFADSLLGDVRNKDAGAGGEALAELLKKVRELDVDALGGGSGVARIPIIGKLANTFDRFATRYQKVASSIDRIVDSLERARMALLKDMTVLDKMFELNLDYLKQLDVYIAAGERVLEELRDTKIPALEAEVAASEDVMVAQRLTDLQQAATRFERRLHDLKLTRMVAVQTAPQIRLIQGNDQNLVEKIQSIGAHHDPALEEPDHHRHQPVPAAGGARAAEDR